MSRSLFVSSCKEEKGEYFWALLWIYWFCETQMQFNILGFYNRSVLLSTSLWLIEENAKWLAVWKYF